MYSPSSPDNSSGGGYERAHAPARPAARGRDTRWRLPTPSQWLLLVGGVLIVAGSALPWWSVTLPSGRVGASAAVTLASAGWSTASGKVVVALGAIVLLLALLRVLRVPLPSALAPRERVVYVALGAEALLLEVLALLDGVHVFTSGGYIAASIGIGLYLALAGAVAAIAGGWLHQADAAWML